jgi:hypothetical protein
MKPCTFLSTVASRLSLFTAVLALAGCLDYDLQNAQQLESAGASVNAVPTLAGSPQAVVMVGESYAFIPVAADADGNKISFSISNQPRWASFDSNSGRLAGNPTAADVGTYSSISIAASDGTGSTTLKPFSITVADVATGNVSLMWQAPTLNADGTPLTDLAGYRIYYGRSAEALSQIADINSVGITSYVIGNLSPGNWYFAIKAHNSNGVESDLSGVLDTTVS